MTDPEQLQAIVQDMVGPDYEPEPITGEEVGDPDAPGLDGEQYRVSRNGIDGTNHGIRYQS